MQTLTFTQKLLRQRRFLSSLIPLLALFLGLGAPQTASAGIIITNSTVTISRNGGANEDITAAQFEMKRLGTYDINTGQLLLNGGSFTAAATLTTVLTAGFIDYTVTDSLGAPVPAGSGSIQLAGTPTSGSPRNFTLSTAAVNLLNGIATANPGYNISITFRATGRTGTNNTIVRDDNGGSGYNAFFNVTGVITPPNTVTFSNQSVTVDQGNGSVTRPALAFNGAMLLDQKPGAVAPFAFDINTGTLLLKGGSITTTATGTSVVSGVNLNYRILSPSPSFAVVAIGMLQLTPTALASGGVRTFELSTGTVNVIAPIMNAGNGYILSISYQASYQNGSSLPTTATDNGPTNQGYNATFDVTGIRPNPTSIGPVTNPQGTVLINTTGATTPNTTYTASAFQGTDLDMLNMNVAYDINNGKLTLNGGNATTFESGGDAVQTARLMYLIVKPAQGGQPGIAFPQSSIPLNAFGTPTANGGGVTRTFANSTALRNLISGLANSGTGTYTISVTYEAVVLRANGSTFTVRDDNGGLGYTASFMTSGTPIMVDTWTGGLSDDWFTPGNWDLKRIPDAITNVVIPDFGSGNPKPYPNIYSGVSYVFGTTTIDNTNSGPALSRDVDMQGTSSAQRSVCLLSAGRWKVYGSFFNDFGSYRQFDGSILEFAGAGNQTISGGLFTTVELSGGGTKDLSTIMEVSTSMTFVETPAVPGTPAVPAGLFTTNISNPDNNYVRLGNRSSIAPNGAQLNGETSAGYIRGLVQTTRNAVASNEVDPVTSMPAPRTYGNMGMTLMFTGANNPGDVFMIRNTAESYSTVLPTMGGTTRFGIRRIFTVRPSNTQPLVADLTFRYLDTELAGLGPQGTGSVPEQNLNLFFSTTVGDQFGNLGVDALDMTSNILSKSGVRTFAIFTLGDKDKPLPVSLVAFDAKRVGNDALITWETASELNNKGYDVQVSNNGKEYRTLGFVAAESPNSNNLKKYSFVDGEKNKVGQRYYRLRQVDVNGKENYFSPRIVNFEGRSTDSSLAAYPNPFNSADQFNLSLEAAVAGAGQITVTDMTGRIVSRQKVEVVSGSNNIPVKSMDELKAGLYLVKLILPSGEMKSLKVVKQ